MHINDRAKQLLDWKNYIGLTQVGYLEGVELGKLDLQCPHDTQAILRMPVRYRMGELLLPQELEWVRPLIELADKAMPYKALFTYVTVHCNFETDGTDEDWHVDGFSMRVSHLPEQNFLWSNTGGTEFFNGVIEIPDSFDPMLHNINKSAQLYQLGENIVAKPYTVYRFDPYIFHKAPSAKAGRTFVRVSYVPIEIDDINNTQNPLLPRHYTFNGVEFRNKLSSV